MAVSARGSASISRCRIHGTVCNSTRRDGILTCLRSPIRSGSVRMQSKRMEGNEGEESGSAAAAHDWPRGQPSRALRLDASLALWARIPHRLQGDGDPGSNSRARSRQGLEMQVCCRTALTAACRAGADGRLPRSPSDALEVDM